MVRSSTDDGGRDRAGRRAPAPGRRAPAGDASTRAVYVISVAAELAGMHPQTLRIYERRGLLDPSRTTGGSRRFSERDLERLRHIQELTAEGLNIAGVRRVIALETRVAELQAQLDETRAEAVEAVERVHRQYRRELVPVSQAPVPYVRKRR